MEQSKIVGMDGKPFVIGDNGRTFYDSATLSKKRSKRWFSPATGPNSALKSNLRTIRSRSQAAYRNSPIINNGIEKLVSNEIGLGIRPYPQIDNEELREQIVELWEQWGDECDADGVLNIYGLQEQMCRARRTAGEVFSRFRFRRPEDGLSVPLQLQVIEADFCPHDLSRIADNGNEVKSGIEFNRIGQRRAYWMHTHHPYEAELLRTFVTDYVQIPAQNIIHHYIPTRPGQLRGEPDVTQSLLKSHTLESYDDAELLRKETRAPFTGAIYREMTTEDDHKFDPISGQPLDPDEADMPAMNVESGSMLELLPGEKIELFDGDQGDPIYQAYMRQQLIAIAAGLSGIPYEILTGDYKDVNDRLIRAIMNQFYRQIEMIQDHYTIFQVCKRIWAMFMDMAVLSGALVIPDYGRNRRKYLKCDWQPTAWPYVHPEQDINAAVKAIEANLDSVDDVLMRRGKDPRKVARNQARAEQRVIKERTEHGLPPVKPNTKGTPAPQQGQKNDIGEGNEPA